MLPRKVLLLILVIVLLKTGCSPMPSPSECSDAINCVEIAPGEPIKIGVIQNFTGQGPPGQRIFNCVELAKDDRDGQLLGHPIELDTADGKCSGEGGTTAALKLTADPQIVGIIGPSCSSAAVTASKIVSESGLVMITSSSTAPSLTSVGGEPGSDWQPGFLRTSQNDSLAGRAAAIFAFQELGKRRAATINLGDPYTRGLTDSFRQTLIELGGQLVLDAAINMGDNDMRPVLNAVAASGAELLYFPVFEPEGDFLTLQAAELESFKQITLMSADGLYFETFIAAVGEAGVGMYLASPTFAKSPEYNAFLARFEAKYQEAPIEVYDASTYDAANLLFDAIKAIAVQDENGTLHIGRQALRDTLYATNGYQGLTGSLTCDQHGDCGLSRFKITRLDDPAAGLKALDANVIWTYPPDE